MIYFFFCKDLSRILFDKFYKVFNQCESKLAIFDPKATKKPAIIAKTIISILLLFEALSDLDGSSKWWSTVLKSRNTDC